MEGLIVIAAALGTRFVIDKLVRRGSLSQRRAAVLLPTIWLVGGLLSAAIGGGTSLQVIGVFVVLFAVVAAGNSWLAWRAEAPARVLSKPMPSTPTGLRTAVKEISRYLNQYPNDAAALQYRAAAYLDLRQVPEARADIDRAIRIAPTEPANLQVRAGVRLLAKDPAGAIDDLTRSIALRPDDGLGYLLRGHVRANMGETAAAFADYDAATSRGNLDAAPAKAALLAATKHGSGSSSSLAPHVPLPDAD